MLQALTQKFRLSPAVDLSTLAAECPVTLTGADLYALAADAWMLAMKRVIARHEQEVQQLRCARQLHSMLLAVCGYVRYVSAARSLGVWSAHLLGPVLVSTCLGFAPPRSAYWVRSAVLKHQLAYYWPRHLLLWPRVRCDQV